MVTAAVFFADGFEEVEAITPCDLLARAGVDVTTVGVTGKEVKGAHGGVIRLQTQATLAEILKAGKTYDVLVLPGGLPGAQTLADTPELVQLLKDQKAAGRYIAAICASPALTLHGRGVMDPSQKGVCFNAMGSQMGGNYIADESVKSHVDGKIITSRGPGTAMDFGLTIIKTMIGESKAKEIAGNLLYDY
eukprot:Blabericola_migrator_1__6795@NODE_343_length_9585_cov_71_071023_g276_i0_p4_GENE_NODE_343_length_9585_cov_71_071023_g276_i0NODE_343_length_9585_cov_71_071023_g276_i0_p4_ORF_typecomplete_len191_score45_44DJ1_PfpI/PF01965_24/8_5e34ThiJ_like/PF17124_5/12ThiJ_like/PF17124_5/4_7e06Catalase_C/PF18011_1/0_00015GATase_3/PF07685_14/0_11_NODE_343_length_9585_cov_71_071023_g276_i076378209